MQKRLEIENAPRVNPRGLISALEYPNWSLTVQRLFSDSDDGRELDPQAEAVAREREIPQY